MKYPLNTLTTQNGFSHQSLIGKLFLGSDSLVIKNSIYVFLHSTVIIIFFFCYRNPKSHKLHTVLNKEHSKYLNSVFVLNCIYSQLEMSSDSDDDYGQFIILIPFVYYSKMKK